MAVCYAAPRQWREAERQRNSLFKRSSHTISEVVGHRFFPDADSVARRKNGELLLQCWKQRIPRETWSSDVKLVEVV